MDHNLVAGAVSGVLTALILHPIDLVKVRLQVQDGRTRAENYRGIRDAVSRIWANEGVRGFYRGVGPGCWGSGASWGLYFFFYESSKRRLQRRNSQAAGPDASEAQVVPKLTPLQHVYAAWEGGTITCLFTNPIWLVKTRMQLQGQGPDGSGAAVSTKPSANAAAPATASASAAVTCPQAQPQAARAALAPYRSMVDAFASIVREEGPRGLYRGLLPALLLVSHGMIQFAAYEEAKHLMPVAIAWVRRWQGRDQIDTQVNGQDSRAAATAASAPSGDAALAGSYLFAAAAVSKAIATTATYPYQVIKARLQQRFADAASREYTGFLDAVRKIWRHEGGRGFYRGFTANILRVAPQSAVTITVYEAVKHALDDAFPQQTRAAGESMR